MEKLKYYKFEIPYKNVKCGYYVNSYAKIKTGKIPIGDNVYTITRVKREEALKNKNKAYKIIRTLHELTPEILSAIL